MGFAADPILTYTDIKSRNTCRGVVLLIGKKYSAALAAWYKIVFIINSIYGIGKGFSQGIQPVHIILITSYIINDSGLVNRFTGTGFSKHIKTGLDGASGQLDSGGRSGCRPRPAGGGGCRKFHRCLCGSILTPPVNGKGAVIFAFCALCSVDKGEALLTAVSSCIKELHLQVVRPVLSSYNIAVVVVFI